MDSEIKTVYDEERRCGWRREGVYLVSGSNSTGGFGVSGEAAGLILLDPPIPVDPETVPKRGFCYVDGEAVLSHPTDGTPLAAPQVDADLAEARAFSWRTFGMDYPDRVGQGICAGLNSIDLVIDAVTGVSWRDRSRYERHAYEIADVVERLRDRCGDAAILPLIVAGKQLQVAGSADNVAGYGLIGAAAALAASWRLIDVARRLDMVEVVQRAVGYLMTATTGAADAAYALRFRPPSYAIAPDVLDWVGQRHYPTAESFIEEADRLGVSRRMPGIPKAIVTPWSRAFLAHAVVTFPDGSVGPGIFGTYQVAQVQQVMGEGQAVPPWLKAYHVQPVCVERVVAQEALFPA